MKVELHQAFMYDCPECGRENFVRAINMEIPPEDQEDLLRELTGNEWDDMPEGMHGIFLMAPVEVECAFCGEVLETVPPIGEVELEDMYEDEEDDEEDNLYGS